MRTKVFVIDDDPVICRLLAALLPKFEIDAQFFSSAESAQETLLHSPFLAFLGLVDWNLPGHSGFDFCSWLKLQPDMNPSYLIMISARSEKTEMARALAFGADDYITKPIHESELHGRLIVGLRTLGYQQQIQSLLVQSETRNRELEATTSELSKCLETKETLALLGQKLVEVSHEIINPLQYVSGNLDFLVKGEKTILAALAEYGRTNPDPLTKLLIEDLPGIFNTMTQGTHRIHELAKRILTSLKTDSRFELCDLGKIAESALNFCSYRLVGVQVDCQFGKAPFLGNSLQMEQVLVNLICNAADAMEGQKIKNMRFVLLEGWSTQILLIQDSGTGIKDELFEKIFDPFFTTKGSEGNGIGLSICQRILARHGGGVSLENRGEGGTEALVWIQKGIETTSLEGALCISKP